MNRGRVSPNRSSISGVYLLAIAAVICAIIPNVAIADKETNRIIFQEGLPRALKLDVERAEDGSIPDGAFSDQAEKLGQLAAWAGENRPKKGWLEKILGSSEGPKQISPWQLMNDADSLRGEMVAVEGLYIKDKKREDIDALFPIGGDECLLSLAEGVKFDGFSDEKPYGLPVKVKATVEGNPSVPILRVFKVTPALGLSLIRQGRAYEMAGEYEDAVEAYAEGDGKLLSNLTNIGPFARIRAADLAFEQLSDNDVAQKHYHAAWDSYVTNTPEQKSTYFAYTPVEKEKKWKKVKVHAAAAERLDSLNSESFWYSIVDLFTRLCGGSAPWGVIVMAVLVRMLIWPLTKKQLASAEAMKKLQPQIKKLQDEYSEDKQKFQEEFWELCQANNVNPLGGCLPLLVQFPVLIMIYKGIRLYIVNFSGVEFLWMSNLAAPDLILLIAYTLSMIGFQWLSQRANPQAAMDPQQQQQQKMMMFLMPVMFFFIFRSFPAAFILYWLGMNLTYFGQQIHYRTMQADGDEQQETQQQPDDSGGGLFGRLTQALAGEPAGIDECETALTEATGDNNPADDDDDNEAGASEGDDTHGNSKDDKNGTKRKPPKR